MTITRRTVLVTGCSAGGVGAALAEVFRAKGYHVYATARTPSKVPESLHSASNVAVLALDVTSTESIAAAADQVSKEGGKLDVLINNAGAGLPIPALDTPMEKAKQLFDLTFFGALAMLQAFGPLLIKAKGCVVNHASVAGVMGFPFSSKSPSEWVEKRSTPIPTSHLRPNASHQANTSLQACTQPAKPLW